MPELLQAKPIGVQIFDLNAGAGANTLESVEVPEGEVWYVSVCSAWDVDTNITKISLRITGAGDPFGVGRLKDLMITAINETCAVDHGFYLPEKSKIAAVFTGCGAGDDIYLEFVFQVCEEIA